MKPASASNAQATSGYSGQEEEETEGTANMTLLDFLAVIVDLIIGRN